MSKKKTSAHPHPQSHPKPVHNKPDSTKLTPAQRLREAKDARRFFLVLGIGTVLLVVFLYFIFIGRG